LRETRVAFKSQISCTPSNWECPVIGRPKRVRPNDSAYPFLRHPAERRAQTRPRKRPAGALNVSGHPTRYVRMPAHWRSMVAKPMGPERADRVARSAGRRRTRGSDR
jgi:hypothetical protein